MTVNIQFAGNVLSGSTAARTNGPGNSSFHAGRVVATRGQCKLGVGGEGCAGCHLNGTSRPTSRLHCKLCKHHPGCRGLHRLQLQGAFAACVLPCKRRDCKNSCDYRDCSNYSCDADQWRRRPEGLRCGPGRREVRNASNDIRDARRSIQVLRSTKDVAVYEPDQHNLATPTTLQRCHRLLHGRWAAPLNSHVACSQKSSGSLRGPNRRNSSLLMFLTAVAQS